MKTACFSLLLTRKKFEPIDDQNMFDLLFAKYDTQYRMQMMQPTPNNM